jgi:hypothetical protein
MNYSKKGLRRLIELILDGKINMSRRSRNLTATLSMCRFSEHAQIWIGLKEQHVRTKL